MDFAFEATGNLKPDHVRCLHTIMLVEPDAFMLTQHEFKSYR